MTHREWWKTPRGKQFCLPVTWPFKRERADETGKQNSGVGCLHLKQRVGEVGPGIWDPQFPVLPGQTEG